MGVHFRIEPTVSVLLLVFALAPLGCPGTHAARAAEPAPGAAPLRDARLTELRHLDRRYPWTPPASRAAWERRARELRRHILVSAGLRPMPARTPLRPQIFGRVERSGYTVEKVYFESHPGLFVTGNLYRPLGKRGPFPVVLNPHGHWTYGRLEATDNYSGPELGASLARQGAIVFAWDMIGYTDSVQLSHELGGAREALWGISLAGLQLWNALRAVDFVAGLPDADAGRIACTGASGGGTQTFLLAAIEPRISVAVPVNMVSSRMQGGCLCENPPLLRRDTFNVELAAGRAPQLQPREPRGRLPLPCALVVRPHRRGRSERRRGHAAEAQRAAGPPWAIAAGRGADGGRSHRGSRPDERAADRHGPRRAPRRSRGGAGGPGRGPARCARRVSTGAGERRAG